MEIWLEGGESYSYYKNGKVKLQTTFKSGFQEDWAIRFDSLGNMQSKAHYKSSKASGKFIEYYTTAEVLREIEVRGDSDTLLVYEYFKKGGLKRCYFNLDDKTLYSKTYSEDGSLKQAYIPFVKKENQNDICLRLNTSIHERKEITVKVHLVDSTQIAPKKEDIVIEGNGYNICLNRNQINEHEYGFLCEVDNKTGNYLGYIKFKF